MSAFIASARAAEVASARWWLISPYLGDLPDERPSAGERVTAAELYREAAIALGEVIDIRDEAGDEWPHIAEGDGYPREVRVPGSRTFYAVADEVFGPRSRGVNGAHTYTIPPAYRPSR